MSNQTTFSSSSYSYSSSSSNDNGQVSGHRHVQQSVTDSSGNTTTQSASQKLGEPVIQETRQYDSQGQELLGSGSGGSSSRRIEDVSDKDQAARDREYEERMEDE